MNKIRVYVCPQKLYQLKKYYEAQIDEYRQKFKDSQVVDFAIDHALGNEVKLIILKKKCKKIN
jgi:hypothetical protein